MPQRTLELSGAHPLSERLPVEFPGRFPRQVPNLFDEVSSPVDTAEVARPVCLRRSGWHVTCSQIAEQQNGKGERAMIATNGVDRKSFWVVVVDLTLPLAPVFWGLADLTARLIARLTDRRRSPIG